MSDETQQASTRILEYARRLQDSDPVDKGSSLMLGYIIRATLAYLDQQAEGQQSDAQILVKRIEKLESRA